MAKAKKGSSEKTFEKKGDKKCYTGANATAIANRVAGGLKARGKRVKVTGRCVELV